MRRCIIVALIAVGVLFVPLAQADLIVTLEPKDADMNPIVGDIPTGAEVFVDILLSVEGDDNPLADLRNLQFDFAATSPGIELGTFTWEVDPSAYTFQITMLPTPSATSLMSSSASGLLTLSEEPIRVATVEVTVSASGTLNAVGSTEPGQMSRAEFDAGFPFVAFSLAGGNLQGGQLVLSVADPTDPSGDSDGDGVPNLDDAFPDDPAESADTDSDGVGNNTDEDDDDDGVDDADDAFPLDPAEASDSDQDGVGDNGDAFPTDPEETSDTDDDGVGDNTDIDDDNDGVDDIGDAFPLDPTETADSDGDGIGDNTDQDSGVGPPTIGRLCGVAMLSTSVFVMCGLLGLRLQCRRWRGCGII